MTVESSTSSPSAKIDELNSSIGVLLAAELPPAIRDALLGVQNDLFDLGGEVCIPGHRIISEAHIVGLETRVAQFNDELTPLKEFILPGGTMAAALAHLARTVCRRAERRVVHLSNHEPVSDFALKYLNRLSDLLFVLGRALNVAGGRGDVLWNRNSPT